MKKRTKKLSKKAKSEILDYDLQDVTSFVRKDDRLEFADLGLKLPKKPPTEVVSIRLPTGLLNQIRAMGSQQDIPYQALIKLFLSESLKRRKELPR